jgi:hypothetical protein
LVLFGRRTAAGSCLGGTDLFRLRLETLEPGLERACF